MFEGLQQHNIIIKYK